MLRRLTDLWPTLLRANEQTDNELTEPLLSQDQQNDGSQDQDDIDEAQLLEDFRHLYWTRLMRVQDYEVELERKFPLGPDVVEECKTVASIQLAEDNDWKALFDPEAFNKEYGPLLMEKYQLSQSDLQEWAIRAVDLRVKIRERAKQYEQPQPN